MVLKMFQLDKDKIMHRWFFLIYSIITLLFTSGIVFGWSAILLVFLKEGQYNEFCFMEDGVENCERQLLKLNRIYTISVITILVAGPIFGFLVDFIKTRACLIISAVVISIGCTLASFSDSKTFDAWIPAFVCISLGTSGVYFSTLPLAQIFKGKEGLASSGFSGAFDSSSVVFILYQTINSFTNWSLKSFFMSYNAISFVVLIMALIIPTDKGTFSDIDMEETKENTNDNNSENKEGESLIKKAPLEYRGQFDHLDFKSVFKVPFFYIQLTLFVLTMLWYNMYMGSIEFRMKFLTTNEHDVQNLVIIYSYIMPASIVISPLIGYLLDHKGTFVSMFISQFLMLLWAICVFVPKWPYFQIVSFCMFSCARPFFYAVAISSIPKIFGFNKMGRIFGLFSICGAAFTYLQYLFVEITVTKFHGDWLFVNCMQLGSTIFCFSYLYFLKKVLSTPPPPKN